jgi:uncharacterized protein (DUF1697 family)
MNTAISMLRGINVGGQKKVPMEELKKCYESLGFENIRTYIQSGNVVFDYQGTDTPVLAERLERGIRDTFGFDVTVVIRTSGEMLKVIRAFPFTSEEEAFAHVTFLSKAPSNFPAEEVEKARGIGEKCVPAEREVYLYCPNGYGRTKLSNSLFERKLRVEATTRNWRTVGALYALARRGSISDSYE